MINNYPPGVSERDFEDRFVVAGECLVCHKPIYVGDEVVFHFDGMIHSETACRIAYFTPEIIDDFLDDFEKIVGGFQGTVDESNAV